MKKDITHEIVELARQLIAIPSVPEDSLSLEKVLDTALQPLTQFTVSSFEKDGCKSVLIHNRPASQKHFELILNGHLDIIPGKSEQYIPKIINNRLYGAGSMDMKANTAAMILAFRDTAQNISYPLGLQLVTDEEIGGFKGTKYQLDCGVRAKFVLVGEATQFQIENKMKGVLQMNISSHGMSAHSAYPWKGENAIRIMNEFLTVLFKRFPIPDHNHWVTTINAATLNTNNTAYNKIPDHCTTGLDIRYIPEDASTIKDTIISLLPNGFTYEIIVDEPAVHTDESVPYVSGLQKIVEQYTGDRIQCVAANGSSDVRHFSRLGIPGVEFGPIGQGMGSDQEWVDIKSLETYYTILCKFLNSID